MMAFLLVRLFFAIKFPVRQGDYCLFTISLAFVDPFSSAC
jgi:hypothetical protein